MAKAVEDPQDDLTPEELFYLSIEAGMDPKEACIVYGQPDNILETKSKEIEKAKLTGKARAAVAIYQAGIGKSMKVDKGLLEIWLIANYPEKYNSKNDTTEVISPMEIAKAMEELKAL